MLILFCLCLFSAGPGSTNFTVNSTTGEILTAKALVSFTPKTSHGVAILRMRDEPAVRTPFYDLFTLCFIRTAKTVSRYGLDTNGQQ